MKNSLLSIKHLSSHYYTKYREDVFVIFQIFGFLFFFLIYSCSSDNKNSNHTAENCQLLNTLDSLIATQSERELAKEKTIENLRTRFQYASAPQDKLDASMKLFNEYKVYDSDSALYYARIARKIAPHTSGYNKKLDVDLRLNEAFIEGVMGKFDSAVALVNEIDTVGLDKQSLCKYFDMLGYILSLGSIFIADSPEDWSQYIGFSNNYRDSVIFYNTDRNPAFFWIPIALKVDNLNKTSDISYPMDDPDFLALKQITDSVTFPTREDAINAYWVSRYYEVAGDSENKLKYQTLAAIYDAKIVNKELAAVQEVANQLLDQGDLNRAYNYLTYAIDQANTYNNRSRIVSLAKIMGNPRKAYQDKIEQREKKARRLTISLAIVAGILILTLILVIYNFRKIHKQGRKLTTVNEQLKKSIEDRNKAIDNLRTANEELNAANKQKIQMLAYALQVTREYITSLDNFRKRLLKKYKGKQIDDLGLLLSDPEVAEAQNQTFYKHFDQTVLAIFPNFFKEYNDSVKDEFKIADINEGKGELNTRMRIYALKRLGMDKSSDIAEMLNISIRTVYNNRL